MCSDIARKHSGEIKSSQPNVLPHLTTHDWEFSRVYRTVIVTDFGQPIDMAPKLKELAIVARDCLLGYRDLYTKLDILHGDLSINNMLYKRPTEDAQGFLIDLDLAIDGRRDSHALETARTGTPQFMSIGQLNGENHQFYHGIESAFWILFYICVVYEKPGQRKKNHQIRQDIKLWDEMGTHITTMMIKKGILFDVNPLLQYREAMSSHYVNFLDCLAELHQIVKHRFSISNPTPADDDVCFNGFIQALQKFIGDSSLCIEG